MRLLCAFWSESVHHNYQPCWFYKQVTFSPLLQPKREKAVCVTGLLMFSVTASQYGASKYGVPLGIALALFCLLGFSSEH
jgi:hypothetical protein